MDNDTFTTFLFKFIKNSIFIFFIFIVTFILYIVMVLDIEEIIKIKQLKQIVIDFLSLSLFVGFLLQIFKNMGKYLLELIRVHITKFYKRKELE